MKVYHQVSLRSLQCTESQFSEKNRLMSGLMYASIFCAYNLTDLLNNFIVIN
jgi:hypothetical protein